MKRCSLPLASSAGWFERASLLQDLERRIKVMLLLHDELIVDDGAYRFMVTDGSVVEQPQAPSAITHDRFDLRFLTGQHAIVPPTITYLGIDFRAVFHRAGLIGAEGITWTEQALVPNVRRGLRAHAERIASAPGVVAALPIGSAEREALVKNWLFDSFLAHSLEATISLDERAGPFFDACNRAVEQLARPRGTAEVALRRVALVFELPDVDALSWGAVFELRSSPEGRAMREKLAALAEGAVVAADEQHVSDFAVTLAPEEQQAIDTALQRDRFERESTRVVLALNYAPVAGFELLGDVSNLARAITRARDWTAVVGRGPRRS